MTWFLDGNNILGFLGTGKPGAGGQRERLLDWLLSRSVPTPAVVVFDGPPPEHAPAAEGRRGKVRVRYSAPRRADEVIHASVRPGDFVVTNDRELAMSCRDRQARHVPVKAFLERLGARGEAGHEKPGPAGVDVEEWMEFFGRKEGPGRL